MTARPEPSVRAITAEEVDTYARVDAAAFGGPPEWDQVEAKRPLMDPARFLLAELDGEPVGAAGSLPMRLTLPGGADVAFCAVADVGVLPTHRRRGVLRSLMRHLLVAARDAGEVVAGLNASEATIYGRFGFGAAVPQRVVRVDARRGGFHPAWPDPGGRCRILERGPARPTVEAVYASVAAARPGHLSRSAPYWDVVLGDVATWIGGGDRRLVMVHESADGVADGYALYDVDPRWEAGSAAYRIQAAEVVAADPGVELALWRSLLDHDLAVELTARVPADHLLHDALADVRALQVELDADHLWVRPLDVSSLLGRRGYATDATLVLEVVDGFLDAGGTFRLEAAAGSAACGPAPGQDPELTLGVAELGAVLLGGTSFARLQRVGRLVEHRSGAVERADALFRVDRAPWCPSRF